jgi:hypothetical protein
VPVIVAGILVARLKTADDLFGGPQGGPRTDAMIAAAIQSAERILRRKLMLCSCVPKIESASRIVLRGVPLVCKSDSPGLPTASQARETLAKKGSESLRVTYKEKRCDACAPLFFRSWFSFCFPSR